MNDPTHPHFAAALAAVDRGENHTLVSLLRQYPDLVHARCGSDQAPYDGYFWRATLLHHTAANPIRQALPENAVEIARTLIEAGAEVDAECGGGPSQPESGGGTTLGLLVSGSEAYRQGLTEPLLDVLLEAGAGLDPAGNGGLLWIALYHTVENQGQREAAKLLVDRGHGVDLCFAAGVGDLPTVRSYFRRDGTLLPGADHYYRHHRSSGERASDREILEDALIFSAITGRREVAEYLLDGGVDVNAPRSWGPETVTPLHAAAWAGWEPMARFLLERGADTKSRDLRHSSTPLGWAAYCKRPDVLELLLVDEANLDLEDALEFGRFERFRELFGDGDPNLAYGASGEGILLRAASYWGHLDFVRFLLERGADRDLAGPEGKTALDLAVEQGHEGIAQLLRAGG